MKVLVIDIGGTNVKVASTDMRVPIKIPSGPHLAAKMMVDDVLKATKGWEYDCITLGYPGPVTHDAPLMEPPQPGSGVDRLPLCKSAGQTVQVHQ